MKNIATLTLPLFFFAFCLFLGACSKDDNQPAIIIYPEENPLQEYITKANYITPPTNFINTVSPYEMGFGFKPLFKGKINALVIKIPDTNLNLRVTIWDKTTRTPIRTENVNVTASDTEIVKLIEPLQLKQNKEYSITINTEDFYMYSDGNGNYPFTSGNIQILDFSDFPTLSQTFPTNFRTKLYYGNCSFKFQRTE